jgi:hypothetical protein
MRPDGGDGRGARAAAAQSVCNKTVDKLRRMKGDGPNDNGNGNVERQASKLHHATRNAQRKTDDAT